jgi:malonate-semialdehyde dehydrogenase (acetylating)/methylmalonate-semialdehyde dehydrogenase
MTRERYLQDYLHVMRRDHQKLAEVISREHGKVIPDSMGDIQRGLEMIEHSSNINNLYMGETLENIAKNVDCYSYRNPLGVCAGVCAFNFPAMIPLWVSLRNKNIDVPFGYCLW